MALEATTDRGAPAGNPVVEVEDGLPEGSRAVLCRGRERLLGEVLTRGRDRILTVAKDMTRCGCAEQAGCELELVSAIWTAICCAIGRTPVDELPSGRDPTRLVEWLDQIARDVVDQGQARGSH